MRIISSLLLLALCQGAYPQESRGEIALPSKQYLMEGVSNEIYTQTFLRRPDVEGGLVRFEGSAGYTKQGGHLPQKAVIDSPLTGQTMVAKLISPEDFAILDSVTSQIIAATPRVGEKQVRVQFLGDSFTKGIYFKYAFLESGYVPNVKLIGTRAVPDFEGQFHEGRGGWTLEKYFSNMEGEKHFYNPYLQPVGEYKYWGNSAFWRAAVELEETPDATFDLRYNCGDYDTSAFGKDGLPLSPRKGDLLYDNDSGGYIAWSGRAWKSVEKPAEWRFDYSKYLKMWQLESPQFLVVMLGMNDFRDLPLSQDFTEWNAMVMELLASYRAAVPDGRMVLCTPCTSCGVEENEIGYFTTKQNAAMWEVRKNIIDVFDMREDEGIYVVDASAAIDNENGYNVRNGLQYGNPHPYLAYPALGVPIAAFVQHFREN